MRLAEYLAHFLGYRGCDSTKKLRHLTTHSLNHQILKFGGALITIDCAGLSYLDFALGLKMALKFGYSPYSWYVCN